VARRLVVDLTPLTRYPDFRRLWVGQLLAQFGRQSATLALAYQVYAATDSPLAIGGIAVASLVPLLLFSIPGGGIADVVDRRWLLIGSQVGQVVVSLGLFLATVQAQPSLMVLYFLAFGSALLTTLDRPARRASLPRLVPPSDLAAAIVLDSSIVQVAKLVGPAVAGVLIGRFGLPLVYAIEVGLFAAALFTVFRLPSLPPGTDRPGFSRSSLVEGVRFVTRVPIILASFGTDLCAMVFGLPIALFPVVVTEHFHGNPEVLGLLAASPAIGALIGTVGSGWVGQTIRQGQAIVVAVVIWSVAIIGFGVFIDFLPLTVLALVVAGAADVVSTVFRSAILQWESPDSLRGRVSGIQALIFQGGPRLGDIEATAVAAAFGAQASIVSGGVLCLVGLAAIVARVPALLTYRGPITVAAPTNAVPITSSTRR
jgi:MFS family permease